LQVDQIREKLWAEIPETLNGAYCRLKRNQRVMRSAEVREAPRHQFNFDASLSVNR
jgi:hypothetical protein